MLSCRPAAASAATLSSPLNHHPNSTQPCPHPTLPYPTPQVAAVFEYELRVSAACTPATCADLPGIGGPEPAPAEVAAILDLFQVGSGI